MNARDYLNDEFEYQETTDSRGKSASERGPSGTRQTFNKKRGKSPKQFNGIHRRRKKKIRW